MTTYRTFKRAARSFEEFGRTRKTTVDRGLTLEEAREACRRFNDDRTPAQVSAGLKLEFEREGL